MRTLLILVALAACDSKPITYRGLPPGDVACSSDILHAERGQCIVDGKRYRCFAVERMRDVLISCAPYRLWR